jgi:hypothetical protein
LGVIRVDDAIGKPMATVWNFAIHGASAKPVGLPTPPGHAADGWSALPPGTCWGPEQMNSSADIMGGVNRVVEQVRCAPGQAAAEAV